MCRGGVQKVQILPDILEKDYPKSLDPYNFTKRVVQHSANLQVK